MVGFEGQRFGNYVLRNRIGRGHTASVYYAEHVRRETMTAAVKVLQSELEEPATQKVFTREVEILAQLHHPNIISILDFGVEDAIPYIIMEFAPHGNLDQLHPYKQQVANDKVVYYVKHIANALHYAHEHRIVHCDLKPKNVFISYEDFIKVGDFGYARILASTSRHSTQSVEGTWAYMAPK